MLAVVVFGIYYLPALKSLQIHILVVGSLVFYGKPSGETNAVAIAGSAQPVPPVAPPGGVQAAQRKVG